MRLFRAALFVASAVATGVSLGRRYVKTQVNRQKLAVIESAGRTARERIRSEAHDFVVRHLLHFSLTLLIKAGLLMILVGLTDQGVLGPVSHRLAFAALLLTFLARDTIVTWPVIHFVISELRRNGWRPRLTIGEVVAARVFDEVLEEAADQPRSLRGDLFLALAGQNRDLVIKEIAVEVAAIARDTSWDMLKPYILSGTSMTVTLATLYGAFAWLAVSGALSS